MSGSFAITPTVQSPKAYDLSNLQALQLMTRLLTQETGTPGSVRGTMGQIFYPRTQAESNALVTPVNYFIPSHDVIDAVIVDRYKSNTVPGTTDMTSGITIAESVLVNGGANNVADGGVIQFLGGVYLIDNYNPSRHQIHLRGLGMQRTVLRGRVAGAGATVGVITINNFSRGKVSNLSLDGNALKSYCLGICPTNAGANAGSWTFEKVCMFGAATDTVVLGNSVNSPDVSAIKFIDCLVQGGGFGSASPSNSQVKVDGSNTLLIRIEGGVIGAGAIANNIKILGGELSCHGVNSFASTDYHVLASGGHFRSYDEHCEGTGGYLHTLSTDPQTMASAQHMVQNAQISCTGANSGGRSILHEAPRRLQLVGGNFFAGNVDLNNIAGQIVDGGSTFVAGKGFVNSSNVAGSIYGISGGTLIGFINNGPIVLSSAADVNGPDFVGVLAIVRETSGVGGFAIIACEQTITPNILYQSGALYVTGAPGANQIQVKTRGAGHGLAFRAGTNFDTHTLLINAVQSG